jgi:TolB-like protein/Flp pilus assembly protein TadD
MPDIFISYSRKDSEQATMLAEMLASAGLSCWIDQQGIEAASSWSAQIVDAINNCNVFIALLSPSSIESHNVIKEISLASEKRKRILPLDLEPVTLPRELEYQLAGIQRAPMTNIDLVIRALGKLGLEATGAPQAPKIVKESDGRKSLMILPFEDLSPTSDNGWFADGIVSEMIAALSEVKALRLADSQATKEFRQYRGQLSTYAREMGIRYFVQGDVRKFGDQIKIGVRLLDIETGDYLWQNSMKGTMEDIFDIQEKVAEQVVVGMKIHVTSAERKKLAERETENTEAYELLLKAVEYYQRDTEEGVRIALGIVSEAIALEPGYLHATALQAAILVSLFTYQRDPSLLEKAEVLCRELIRLRPENLGPSLNLSRIYMHRGELEEAERLIQNAIRKDPQRAGSYLTLGSFYRTTGQFHKAMQAFKENVRLDPASLGGLWQLVEVCRDAKRFDESAHWAAVAIPYFQRHLKLQPDDESKRVWYAVLLYRTGRIEDARLAAMQLVDAKDMNSLYNTACIFSYVGDKVRALTLLQKAIQAGFWKTQALREFLTDEEGVVSLAGTPEYVAVERLVDRMEMEQRTQHA